MGKAALDKHVQTVDVVQMKMTQQQGGRFFVTHGDIMVDFIESDPRIQDDVMPLGPDQRADGVAGGRIIPAVRSQKNDLQNNPLYSRPLKNGFAACEPFISGYAKLPIRL
jgi:hypothetical protein